MGLYAYIYSQLSTQFDNTKLLFQVTVDFSMMFILCFIFGRVKLTADGYVSSHSVCKLWQIWGGGLIISMLTRAQTAIGQFARHYKCVKRTVYTSCLAYFASFVSVKFMQIRYVVKLSVLHECNCWACDSLHELVTRN